jgi:hypothetical protein
MICRRRIVQSIADEQKKKREKTNRLRSAWENGIPCGEMIKPAKRKSRVTIQTVGIA